MHSLSISNFLECFMHSIVRYRLLELSRTNSQRLKEYQGQISFLQRLAFYTLNVSTPQLAMKLQNAKTMSYDLTNMAKIMLLGTTFTQEV